MKRIAARPEQCDIVYREDNSYCNNPLLISIVIRFLSHIP